MMRASLIINTAACDPLAQRRFDGSQIAHRDRARLLRERVLLDAQRDDWHEIIVVGSFEPGEGYRYVPMPPVHRDRRDALWQRELGARHATGDLLAFCHDDHTFAPDSVAAIHDELPPWDLLVPRRVNVMGHTLNNGAQDTPPYMGGHALVMRRTLWATLPWTSVDTEWWDLTLTRIWQEEGAVLRWSDRVTHIDLTPVGALVAL